MLAKLRIKSKIRRYKKRIETLEKKRIRSQSALMQAILQRSTPNDADVDFFNRYTTMIDDARRQIIECEAQLGKIYEKN